MVVLKEIHHLSTKAEQYINITEEVLALVRESGIRDGIAIILTAHTTTGILVNEALPCVESDISDTLERIAPLDAPYAHAHFLPDYGATGNNSQGHLKSMITGNHCVFPVIDGEMVRGGAQEIYLAEFDGPQARRVYVEIMGEA